MGTLTVSNSTLSGNYAGDYGGGLCNNGGTLTVSNSTMSGNYASSSHGDFYGGAISDVGGTLTVSNSTVSGNYAYEGGGIYNNGGTLTVSNSTMSGNSASNRSGIWNLSYFATISDSNAIGQFCKTAASSPGEGTLTLNNSIVANTVLYGDVEGSFTGSNNLFGSVQLGPLQDNGGPTQTMALLPGSPAFAAGDIDLVPAGVPRRTSAAPVFALLQRYCGHRRVRGAIGGICHHCCFNVHGEPFRRRSVGDAHHDSQLRGRNAHWNRRVSRRQRVAWHGIAGCR